MSPRTALQVPPADPLRALSRSLLRLSEQAQQAPPQDLLHQALQTLRGLVPFDSAWWGEVSAGESGTGGKRRPHRATGCTAASAWPAALPTNGMPWQRWTTLGCSPCADWAK